MEKKQERLVYREAGRTLVQALVGRKRVVVCTAGNSVSSLMCRAFSDCKHEIIICDEASLCTDPALWNVVVSLASDRIDADFNGKTPVPAVLIVGDHHQGKAVIKSEVGGLPSLAQISNFSHRLSVRYGRPASRFFS